MIQISDDRELLHSFVGTKDEQAFAKIVARHEGMMQAVAGRVCGNSHDAKDAMQRTLVAFVRRAREIRAEPSVGPWLHRATTLEALAIRRQGIKRRIREKQAMEDQQLKAAGMPSEIASELDEAINGLTGKDRTAIVLHFLENHPYQDIASKHGGTAAAWQKRGVRALEKLSSKLRCRGAVATGTALAGWMVATPAEAAVSGSALKSMMGEALRQPMTTGAAMSSSSTLFIIMKLKATLALCFVGGAAISYAWSEWTTPAKSHAHDGASLNSTPTRDDGFSRSARGFNLDAIATAIRKYDSVEDATAYAESRLRSLMFSVPADYIEAVRQLLAEVENPGRFDEIIACLFGRWAELNPEEAWQASMNEKTYGQSSRRGVLLTWLNTDPKGALAGMLDSRSEDDIATLKEFALSKVQHDPRDAARLLDLLAQSWPEADRRLFDQVATAWAFNDPDPAGEWVASYGDREYRNILLQRLAWRVAHRSAEAGLRMADRVDEPVMRTQSRWSALNWAGIGMGLGAIPTAPGEKPDRFPSNWSPHELHGLAVGTMQNHAHHLPRLVELAETEEQRQHIYQGAIVGSAYGKPSTATLAVEKLAPDFATTEEGAKSLKTYIVRWSQMDKAAASAWLEQQPASAKTEVMRQALLNTTD